MFYRGEIMRSYFSVGEVSEMTGFTINALRHYDKIGLVKPAVVNENSNYRYYSQDQLFLFDVIKYAQEAGMSLKEISEILNQKTMTSFKDFLDVLKEKSEEKIELLKQNIQDVDNIKNEINAGEYLNSINDLYRRNIEERDIVVSPTLDRSVNNAYIKQKDFLETEVRNNNLTKTFETGSIYKVINNQATEVSIYRGVVLDFDKDSNSVTRIPAGSYLCITYTLDKREDAWRKFLYAVEEFRLTNPTIIETHLLNDVYDPNSMSYELQVYVSEITE